MRPLHLSIGTLYQQLGAEACAGAMGVSEPRAYKYGQPPEANGEWIPVERLIRLLAFAAASDRKECVAAVAEIVNHFAVPAKLKVISAELIGHFDAGMAALKNGGRLKSAPTIACGCGNDKLVRVERGGVLTFVCSACVVGQAAD